MEDYKYLFKVVLVGNAGVGKTCLVRRFTQGIFPPGQGATIGVDFMIKSLTVDGMKVKLQIWDTAGQERFRSITQSYYRSAQALILVYDVSSKPSFDCLQNWLREIQSFASPNVYSVLVGNKTDKTSEREVSTDDGRAFASDNGMALYLETSAKDSQNVEKLFIDIARHLTALGRSSSLSVKDNLPSAPDGRPVGQSTEIAMPAATHPPRVSGQGGILNIGGAAGRVSLNDAELDVHKKRHIRNEILSTAYNTTKSSCCN